MTEEKFEQARIILKQIESLDKLIAFLKTLDYKCDPPIRSTSWRLVKAIGSDSPYEELNEGEVVAITNALIAARNVLKIDFDEL